MASRVNPFQAFLDGSNKSSVSAQDSVSNASGSVAPNDEAATPYPLSIQTPAETFDQAMFDQALYGDDTAAEANDNIPGETVYDQATTYDQTDQTYDQTTYDQTAYDQSTYDQTTYDQTTYDQTTYDQTAAEAYNETAEAADTTAYDDNAAAQPYEDYYPTTEPAPESVEYGENNDSNYNNSSGNNENSDGWVQYIDDESGLPYWYNEYTGESRWVEVESAEQVEAPIEIKGVWEKYYDDDGNPFYYNTETGQSDWEIPADAILSTGFASDPAQDTFQGQWMGEEEDASLAGSIISRKYPSSSMKRIGSIKSIRSARSFGLQRPNGASNKFTSFSEKVVMIEDQTGQITSRSLKSIKSSASFRLQRVPSVADNLKPKVPIKRKAKNGFQMLKEGATVLREATGLDGVLWMELQSADDGPIFYATEDPESGQWGRPPAFDLLDSPNPKLHRDANGSASPSDSSLEASNEVLDFFLLDKDEALKIISPALARLPSSNDITSGDVPIAMREETTTTSSLTSPLREPIFAGRPPLSARRTEKESMPPSTEPLSPLSLASTKSPKPRSANDSIASHQEKNTSPKKKSFADAAKIDDTVYVVQAPAVRRNEEQEENKKHTKTDNIAPISNGECTAGHSSAAPTSGSNETKKISPLKDDNYKENKPSVLQDNERSLSLSMHNESIASKAASTSKEKELGRKASNESFESVTKHDLAMKLNPDAVKSAEHSPQPAREQPSLQSSPSLLSTDSMFRDVSLADSVLKNEKSLLSENTQPKDLLLTEKSLSINSSHYSLLTTQSTAVNAQMKTEKSVLSHNTTAKDESTMDKLHSVHSSHASLPVSQTKIDEERPIASDNILSKDASLTEKSRSVHSSHSSLSAMQASQPKPESARTHQTSAQASAERTPSKISAQLSLPSSAEKSNDRSNISQRKKENKDAPIVPPLSLPQQTTPTQAPFVVDSESSAILSPLTLAESFQEEEHLLSTKKENDAALSTLVEHAVPSSTPSIGAAHTGPLSSSVASPTPSISSNKKEATSALMLSIQEEAKAELERLRNRLETAKVAFSATHPLSVQEEKSESVREESTSAKSQNEADTSLKAISAEMVNNSFVDPVSASLFISAISEGEDLIAKDIDLIANHSPNDSLFELDDIIFSPAKKKTDTDTEKETTKTIHSSLFSRGKSDSSNDGNSSSQPKPQDAKTNSFLPFSPQRSTESAQKAVKIVPSSQPESTARPQIVPQSSVEESSERLRSVEEKKKLPPIRDSNEPVAKPTSDKKEWSSRSPTKAWAAVEEEPATPIVSNKEGGDGSNDGNGNKFTDFFDFTMVPDMFTNLTVDLAKVEQSSLSRLHALLRREDQFQEDEAQVFLQRLQALNTSTRTNLRGFANPLSEMDTSELRRLRLRMRSLLERCCRVLDRTEASHTELVMNERQLFRAAVYQRQFLQHEVRDLLHDGHFLRFSPDACLFASSLAFRDLWVSLSTRRHLVNSETQSARLTRERLGSWMCFNSANSDKGSSLVFCQPDLRIVQRGEPFDIDFARRATRLTRESWSDYVVNSLVDQRKLEAQGVELLRDEFGGFLFFCPLRKSYSSTGLFGGSLRTQAQRAASSLSTHHSWSEKHTSSKMHRLIQQQRQRARDDQNEKLHLENVWERFPGLELCFTAESDEGPLPRSSLSPSTSFRGSAFSSGKAPAPSPSESLRNSLEACREEFKSSQRGTQSFFLSQMHEDDHDNDNERENRDKTSDAMRDTDLDHWQFLQSAFAVAEEDINATLRLADTRSTVGNDGNAIFASHNNSIKGGEEIIREKQARNALRFEVKMDLEDYDQYANKLVAVFENDPDNALPLLELVELLIYRGLGKQALAALKQATDVLRVSPFYAEGSEIALELALCRVLSVQLSEKYFHFFERTEALIMLTHLHSDSPAVLTHVAALFARQQRFDFAETLLLATLLQDPHYELALLRFADLLSRQGDLQSAIKYLRRITDKTSTIGRSAVLHEAWLQELQWTLSPSSSAATDGSAFVCTAYRECFQSAVKRDRTQSLGLHSLAGFLLSLLSARSQCAEYLQRALQCDPDNAMATFTLSALSTVYQTLRRVSADSFRNSSLTQENAPQTSAPPTNTLSGAKQSTKAKKTKKKTSKSKTTEISGGEKTNKIEMTGVSATATADRSLPVNPFALSDDENASLYLSLEETDSAFRRSIVLFASDALFWLPLLTYADFLHLTLRDTQRAREYYEAAVRRSFSLEIAPVVALAQFLQYTLNDYSAVEELLTRSLRSRCTNDNMRSGLFSLEEFAGFSDEERERERGRESKRGEDDLITECDTNDLLVLYTLIAHFLWDTKRVAAAQRFALAALRLHVSFSPALRLLGLLCFFEGERDKSLAGKYFAAATNAVTREEANNTREESTDEGVRRSPLQRALVNIATMKCEALSFASRHRYDQAIALFEKALSLSASPCVVSYRSLAILLYAYKGRSDRALSLLQRAFEASRGEDIASLRLKAQILMDSKEYDEARLYLQEVLKRVPCDPISLTNLAWCQLRRRKTTRSRSRSRPTTANLPKSNSSSDFDVFGSILLSKEERDNKKNKKREPNFTAESLTPERLQSLAHSQDPQELFAAARATATILCNGGERDYNTGLRFFFLDVSSSHDSVNFPTAARLSHSGVSICAYVYFWEALFHLQESESCVLESERLNAREHAKRLFTMASSAFAAQKDLRESRAPVSSSGGASDKPKSSPEARAKRKKLPARNEMYCVLGKYFLAMIAEASSDFSLAETLLREALAVAASSNNPVLFLRLLRLLESSLMEARTNLRYFQKHPRMDPSISRKIKSSSKSIKNANASSSPADLLFSRSDLDPLQNGIASEPSHLPRSKQSDWHDPSRSLPFFSPKRDLSDTFQSNDAPHSAKKKKRPSHQLSSMLDLQSERENDDDNDDGSPSMARKELIAAEDLLLENELDIAQSLSKSDEEDEPVSHEMNNLVVRVLMHQRVLEAALLKKYSLEKTCKEVSQNLPSKTFVYLEEDWVESSLFSLGKCEDWSSLLLSTGDCLL